MSIVDDQERAIERLLEGRSRLLEGRSGSPEPIREALVVTKEEIEAWNAIQTKILSEIRMGATFSDTWALNGEWVDIKTDLPRQCSQKMTITI